jgi:hypothetical protein
VIFRPELVEKILAGEKAETRRVVKEGEVECRYVPARDYAVQPGRRRRAVGRIAITEVGREKLGEITHEGALREGFSSVRAFLDYWRRLHGGVDPEQEVWVIRFELSEEG